MESQLPAIIVFGILLAITLYGLAVSNRNSDRRNASTDQRVGAQSTYRPLETGVN